MKIQLNVYHQVCLKSFDSIFKWFGVGLTFLSLRNCEGFEDDHMKLFPTSLVKLLLASMQQISGSGFQYLPTAIRSLELNLLPLKDQHMRWLSGMQLESLSLNFNAGLTSECLNYLPSTLVEFSCKHHQGISEESLKQFKEKLSTYV